MKRSKHTMRLVILAHLFKHLKTTYHLEWPRRVFRSGRISEHELDALFAFKSSTYLNGLRSALDRLDHGTFGICIGCAQEIDLALLDGDPARRLCVECERRLSRSPAKELESVHTAVHHSENT